MLKLVIFDCDGVLVDSEAIAAHHLRETIQSTGVSVTEKTVYERFLGMSEPTVLSILSKDFGVTLSADELTRWRADLAERFRNELKPIDGVLDVVMEIRNPKCVASSSSIARITHSLQTVGLLPAFENRLFSASFVKNPKPAPDLFLHAAHTMGADPKSTIVIEDSPAGIVAAQAAGMRVFAFIGGSHLLDGTLSGRIEALEPDLIFGSMSQLPELLEMYQ